MPQWLLDGLEKSLYFMPHGHCYLWIPWLMWLHVASDFLIGAAYVGISLILWVLVRKLRLPFSPVILAFGLFIGLCGGTHFMEIWNVWHPDFIAAGALKSATALASVATALGLLHVRPRVEEVVHAARLSEERRIRLESTNAELESMFAKVRQLDSLKSQFFANVSHDLRTPLSLILGPAEQLLADETLTPAQRRQARTIRSNGAMLLTQVEDLLDLAKLEFDQHRLAAEHVDVVPWLQRLCAQFEIAAEQRGIAYRLHAPSHLAARIDSEKLERVVVNLIANALKATPPGGSLSVRLHAEGQVLCLDVDDSGPGIPPAEREAVFERFRQLDGSSIGARRGSGLGLAIAHEFVALHAGSIAVTDSPAGGARFSVRLPVVTDATAAVATSAADAPSATLAADALVRDVEDSADPVHVRHVAGRAQVLLVEDNPEMQAFIADALSEHFNVAVASDGHDGLARVRSLKPDLVITDLMMPRMGGDELVAALRDDPRFDATPVLLLTAKSDDALRVRLLQRGAQDYLRKPFLPQELVARARNLVEAKRAGDTLRASLASATTDLGELARQAALRNRELQVALDAARLAREQAERATQVKSSFLGMISHELRSPLSTMHLNLQMIVRDRAGTLPADVRPKMERLARATQQMAALVEGLLGYTRAVSGRLDATFQLLDPHELAREVVHEQSDGAPPGVALSLTADPVPQLETDRQLLRVVLVNLVSNALKFTAQGRVTVHVSARDGVHVFAVEDTGPGIPQADLERIFEPFEQLEPLKRKAIAGVGLGLSLVRQLVQALGGQVEVASEVGAGTRFRVTLPSTRLPFP